MKKETNQTLGEKKDKDKHLVKKEKKTNTWPKKRQRQTRGKKRDKDKYVAKKETKRNTW